MKILLLAAALAISAIFPRPPASPPTLGDVNRDGKVNSTDALIVLDCDAGKRACYGKPPCRFCTASSKLAANGAMPCGDVNQDGQVDSSDALEILTYDAGWPAGVAVPDPIGRIGCPAHAGPAHVAPCSGCLK
jgi:hypothetical protein